MSAIELHSLFKIRQRFSSLKARYSPDRYRTVRAVGLALMITIVLASVKFLIIIIYVPLSIAARLVDLRFPNSHAITENFVILRSALRSTARPI